MKKQQTQVIHGGRTFIQWISQCQPNAPKIVREVHHSGCLESHTHTDGETWSTGPRTIPSSWCNSSAMFSYCKFHMFSKFHVLYGLLSKITVAQRMRIMSIWQSDIRVLYERFPTITKSAFDHHKISKITSLISNRKITNFKLLSFRRNSSIFSSPHVRPRVDVSVK